MKARVTISNRGVVTIPAALWRAFGLEVRAELIAEQTPEGILLRPSISAPIEFYTQERIAEFASDDDELAKLYPPPEGD